MIHWLVQTFDELPETDAWLRAEERRRLASFKTPRRKADWLLEQWTAKQLVRRVFCCPLEPHDITILSACAGAPQAYVGGSPRYSLALSHAHGRAFGALLDQGLLGADIQRIERRTAQFVDDYFTPAERRLVQGDDSSDFLTTAIWSAKEAAFRALGLGLTVDSQAINCVMNMNVPAARDWVPFALECDAERLPRCADLQGWWRIICQNGEGFVLTLVTERQAQRSGVEDDERYGVLHRGTGTAEASL